MPRTPRVRHARRDTRTPSRSVRTGVPGDGPTPGAGAIGIRFGPYAQRWIEERPGLSPRTLDLYRWTYRRHLAPTFASVDLAAITPAIVRGWRRELLADGASQSMAAKAYRLLRAILNTAVRDDELIARNPCRIPGAGAERPEERPVLTIEQVYRLADLVPERLRALVLLATFASLRFGEAAALQRRDVDVVAGTVHVRRAASQVRGKGLIMGPPKSRAGVRTVSVPASVMGEVSDHLDTYVGDEPAAFVFTGPRGGVLRRGSFNKLARWIRAVAELGMPGLHFHDLRHTGNMLAAAAGGSTRDLMTRMGHTSMDAALIYQHATARADRHIAERMDASVRQWRRGAGQ